MTDLVHQTEIIGTIMGHITTQDCMIIDTVIDGRINKEELTQQEAITKIQENKTDTLATENAMMITAIEVVEDKAQEVEAGTSAANKALIQVIETNRVAVAVREKISRVINLKTVRWNFKYNLLNPKRL